MNYQTEQAVIGCLLHQGNNNTDLVCYVLDTLKPDSFEDHKHKQIYSAIQLFSKTGKPFDSLAIAEHLKYQTSNDFTVIDSCAENRSDLENLRLFTNRIREKSIERFTLTKLKDMIDYVANPNNGEINDRVSMVETVFCKIADSVQKTNSADYYDGNMAATAWIGDIDAHHNGTLKKFDLGVKGVDEILDPKGIRPGSLIVIGARPKAGKTFLATKISHHYAMNRNERVCIFSMEMNVVDIWERILSTHAKVNSNDFYSVDINSQDPEDKKMWDAWGKANSQLAQSGLFIKDTPGIKIEQLIRTARSLHRKQPISMLIVDYLTLMSGDEKAERNDLKYAEITKRLRNFAKEIGCVVTLLVQLNRGLESRSDKRPLPSDGRDTGQIEQDCDVWIGLYKESVYNKDFPHKGFTEAIVRLNRRGDTGTGYIDLSKGYFEDIPTLQAQQMLQEIEDAKRQEDQNKQLKPYSIQNRK